MGKIISLDAVRQHKQGKEQKEKLAQIDLDYQAKIQAMDKFHLLEEMLRFQEERELEGQFTPKLIIQGQILFQALEETAETVELRNLSRTYRRHLDCENLLRMGKLS